MPKVLLVDPEPDSRGAFERALRGDGYEVSVAASGSFALTQLEWDRPHVIVTQARVDDMDGCELFGLVRSDPKTGDIPFLLLAGLDRHIAAQAAAHHVDRLCTGHVSMRVFLEGVRALLAGEAGAGASAPAANAAPPAEPHAQAMRGTLEVMDLPALAQAIAMGGKTGRLTVTLAPGAGVLEFENGQLVHAEFGGESGEQAFTDLVCASQVEGAGDFCFSPVSREQTGKLPRTVNRSVDRLLLRIAAGIDEGRAALETIEPAAPGRAAKGRA
jgi:CheY-like chemotaxis protein